MRSEDVSNHRWHFSSTRWDSRVQKCHSTWAPASVHSQSDERLLHFLWIACKRFEMHLMWTSEKMQLQWEMPMSKKNDILSDLAALSSAVQTTHKKEDGNVVSRWSWKVPVQWAELQPQMQSGVIERKNKHEQEVSLTKSKHKICEGISSSLFFAVREKGFVWGRHGVEVVKDLRVQHLLQGKNLEVEVEVSMELENAFNWNFCINILWESKQQGSLEPQRRYLTWNFTTRFN